MTKGLASVLWMFFALSIATSAKKMIVIDLTQQEAYAYENDNLIMEGEISTGKPGHRTPKGTFRILQKKLKHKSSKYPEPTGGARMDYMMRLTNNGIAMHLGYVPNYPASHGCIRLKNGFAQKMFAWARVGTKVVIKGNPPVKISRKKRRKKKVEKKVTSNYIPEDSFTIVSNPSNPVVKTYNYNNKTTLSRNRNRQKSVVLDDMESSNREMAFYRNRKITRYQDRNLYNKKYYYRRKYKEQKVNRYDRNRYNRRSYSYKQNSNKRRVYKRRVIHLNDLSYNDYVSEQYVSDPYIRGVKVKQRY